ncbi:WD40-repeat-containing domain [Pseudocohnilembus persalinus]|uniref:WD40-repeat-containing domain n=1 Tax=Pseudocohnilembus persalinus TaxID=266149 RepID=A0A0V0QK23_PSEPJ|nr:WD40-repeat-containing domain [Pseudocohnilembus persalinus]|eukprot:KRX02555.1 WD40-repeat-containing domain [Pseudocohnilembus persalinus]
MESQYNIENNGLIPKVSLTCPVHTLEKATNICCETSCQKNAIMCQQCKDAHAQEHAKYIKPIEKFISQATTDVENHAKKNKEFLNEIFQNQEYQQLFRYIQDSEQHLNKVENHITGQKVLISEDITNILTYFGDTCTKVKQVMYSKLDDFFQHYKEQFSNNKNLIEEYFKLSKSYQFYNNPNNLVSKLSSELPSNANYFVSDLKKAIENAKQMNKNKQFYSKQIKKMENNINQMMDNLPNYQPYTDFDVLMKELQQNCETFMKKNLLMQQDYHKLLVNKDLLSNPRSSSSQQQNFQIINDNKNMLILQNSDEIQLKPLKKFQLEISVTSMTALSDIHLALASTTDNKLRIFESQQKKIHTIQGHSQPITYLTKIITEDKYMNKSKENSRDKSNQKVLLVSASRDFSVILWTFDYDMKKNTEIYSKLIGFSNIPTTVLDLQDFQNIVTGDTSGEICIWDVHNSNVKFQDKSNHKAKITGLCLTKKFDKFISSSEDNTIIVWKLKYNSNKQIESMAVESIIQDEFSGITSINQAKFDPSLVFIGSKLGSLKLYDIYSKKMIAETNAHQTPVLDLTLVEENLIKNENPKFSQKMALLSLGVKDNYVRMWRVVKNKETGEFSFVGLKLDVNISIEEMNSKSKVQILMGDAPKFVLANEKEKELLVYEISF